MKTNLGNFTSGYDRVKYFGYILTKTICFNPNKIKRLSCILKFSWALLRDSRSTSSYKFGEIFRNRHDYNYIQGNKLKDKV